MDLYPKYITVGDVKYVPEKNTEKTFKGIKNDQFNTRQIWNELPKSIEKTILKDGEFSHEIFVRLYGDCGDYWLITRLERINENKT